MENKPKIEYLALDELIPYSRNSRTHSDAQVAQIAASIKEFVWSAPPSNSSGASRFGQLTYKPTFLTRRNREQHSPHRASGQRTGRDGYINIKNNNITKATGELK